MHTQSKLYRNSKDELRPLSYAYAHVGAICIVAASTLTFTAQSHAGNMYVFKDNQGNVLLTNVVGTNKKPTGNLSGYNRLDKVTYYKDTNVHAYKDWGATESSVAPSHSSKKDAYDGLIIAAANRHGIDPALMKAIMHTESGFNPNAKSPVGAQGLMQLMPATASRFGVRNAWNPAENIEGSAKYLKYLKKRFNGDTSLMLAGYNAGEGNVDKYGGIPPFRETQNYVKKVHSRYYNLYRGKMTGSGGGISVYTPSSINRSASDSSYEASAFAALRK